jgi:hypothetical protein
VAAFAVAVFFQAARAPAKPPFFADGDAVDVGGADVGGAAGADGPDEAVAGVVATVAAEDAAGVTEEACPVGVAAVD